MDSINDMLGSAQPKRPEGEPIDLDIVCEHCFWPCEKVFYNREKKLLTAICPNEHVMRSEIGLDYLLDG